MPKNEETNPAAGPRAFSVFLQKVGDGDCHDQVSAEMQTLIKVMREQSQKQAKAVGGKLVLSLTFKAEGDILDVVYDIKTTSPKSPRPRSTFWSDKNGNAVDYNPKQEKLPLRDVSAKGAPKDVGGNQEAAKEA